MTKHELVTLIADRAGTTKEQAQRCLDAIGPAVLHMLENGATSCTIPNLVKVKLVHKPATPERTVTNPATKQPMTVKAKPAHVKLKLTALKALKESVKGQG